MAYILVAMVKVCSIPDLAMVVHGHYLKDVDRNMSHTVHGMYNMDMVVERNTSLVVYPLQFVVSAQPLLHVFFCVLVHHAHEKSLELHHPHWWVREHAMLLEALGSMFIPHHVFRLSTQRMIWMIIPFNIVIPVIPLVDESA
ncbi:hypothetical protein RIF29_14402 [Crotalaria pallida]|uniref:Uncharacterized protein n=1 Tax=Crotalaria pallida TaxID=3830 RepID=A0AAN9IA97_CROPI